LASAKKLPERQLRFYLLSFLRHDFRASITVFFVALPLCLGISLASGAPVQSGLIAGIIGGIVVSLISRSELSVSGPAAGLTAVSVAIILEMGSVELFFISVAIAGILQALIGILRLGGFTHFIPSAVIKGMLAAIGIILISKQVPLLIGYDQPDFWTKDFFNIITLDHAFAHLGNIYHHASAAVVTLSIVGFAVLFFSKKYFSKLIPFLPASFLTVAIGSVLAFIVHLIAPAYALKATQMVTIPPGLLGRIQLTDLSLFTEGPGVWRNAVLICFIASLETLLSVAAIDKLDPYNRITPPNRELIAQGTGNFFSGLIGGLPITAVIVRSSANAEAGARTRLSSFSHGLWILLAVLFAIPLINLIPYCVLAVILFRTGYHLAKPSMIMAIYRQGREQFLPFIVTVIAILLTDLLIGVAIGVAYAIYFLIKHTYASAGFVLRESAEGHIRHFTIELAPNVSFLNKRKIAETLDKMPPYAVVTILGTESKYIDLDVLEIIHDFKSKAHRKHIQLQLMDIPDVETIELH
jgi:MFS superfamily sulfate permease-like transporter